MRVKDIMDEKHPTIYGDELATKARATMRDLSLRVLPVIDDNKKLLGIVTRWDLMAITSSVSAIRVKGIITNLKQVPTVDDETTVAVKGMLRADEWVAPVVNSSQDMTYVGVFGLEDFIEAIVRTSPEKLAKPVSEIMSTKVVTCSPDDEVGQVWHLMKEKSLAGLPVTRNDKLVGILTQKDLLESGAASPTLEGSKGRFRASPKVFSIMKTQVIAVEPSIKAIRVAKAMVSKGIGRVPVKDEDGRLIGIVDREDVARLIIG